MRLRRLDLTRYGKFTDRSIDFGAATPGKADLHIVYGPNEAGKSTALNAWLDLMFGIEMRSRFNFQHPFDTMRIGGVLEIAGTAHELARVKRARATLLDGNGQPIAEGLLAGQLGSIDRESYRAMFSLDDDTLEAGGESILASKGDLGELLFAASAGLAELSRRLTELRAEAEGFYRYHGQNTALAAFKHDLARLREQRDAIDTAASRYAALVETRDVAQRQYEAAIEARAAVLSRIEEIQSHLRALPRLAALQALRAHLAPLADLPAAPPGWRDKLSELQDQAVTLAAQHDEVTQRLAEATAALAAIEVDEAVLAIAARFDRLDVLQARYVTAAKDIPDRQLEVRQSDAQIAGILIRIGRPNQSEPADLPLDTAPTVALQDLMGKRSGIETAMRSAETELHEARQNLQHAEAALRTAVPDGTDAVLAPACLAALAGALREVQNADVAVRRRAAERAHGKAQEQLAEHLLSLRPWQGDAGQLAALAVPEAVSLRNWQAELTVAQTHADRRATQLEQAREEHARLTASRDAIVQGAGVVSDQEAAAIRATREAAWATHRRMLDAATADAFESALRHHDIVMDARLRHEADIARLHHTNEALARAAIDADRAQEEFDKAALRLQRVQGQIEAAAAAFLPGATLDLLKVWLERRDKALQARAECRQAERDLRDAAADAEQLRQGLQAALAAAGVAHEPAATTDALRAAAQTLLDGDNIVRGLRDAVQERRRDLQNRERRLIAATERDTAWQASWTNACAGSWLGASGAPPTVGVLREILAALAELAPAVERRTSLLHRIDKMLADQRTFAAELTALAVSLGWHAADAALPEQAQRIAQAIVDARTAAALRNAKARELTALQQRQRDLSDVQRLHDARSQEITAYFDVASLSQAAARLTEIERKADLQRQAQEATRDILDAVRVASIEDAECRLVTVDRAALETELAALRSKFADQDQATRELFAQFSEAKSQVDRIGGDDAAAQIEARRRTLLLEIQDRAIRYLRLRTGIAAAEQALRSYRQQHRSDMMQRASDAFRRISRGAYTGLASQPKKDGEDLIALCVDGSSKLADQLSKGTRFQLYLALRFAGYCEYARLRPSVPFIADDILETFDDERAEQALLVLADIAERGQAIYLTHHRHLCDIARRVCPDARLHQL